MSLCTRCSNGEYRGLPPADAPEWEVGTVCFWCPILKHHDSTRTLCTKFVRGVPRKFDKFGRECV